MVVFFASKSKRRDNAGRFDRECGGVLAVASFFQSSPPSDFGSQRLTSHPAMIAVLTTTRYKFSVASIQKYKLSARIKTKSSANAIKKLAHRSGVSGHNGCLNF